MKSEKCRKSSGSVTITLKTLIYGENQSKESISKNEIPTKGNKSIINSNLTVMKNLFKSVMALFIGAAMFSCQQAEEPTMDQG